MKQHRVPVLFCLSVCIVSMIATTRVETAHAEQPAQAPTPSGEPSLSEQAHQLYRDSLAFYQRGDMTSALDKLTSALELYRRTDDREGERKTINGIGVIYEDLR